MPETAFQITEWEDTTVLALSYRRTGHGRERTRYAVPNPPDNPAGPLSALLNGISMVSQSWTAHDNR